MDLPLSLIVILYSISFNLFYLAVATILLFKYKDVFLAVLMSFYYILFVSDTYFWTNNEVHQGIAWMFLFFGTTRYLSSGRIKSWIRVIAFIVLGFLSVFTHPLVMFPALFLWLFLVLDNHFKDINRMELIILTGILLAFCAFKFYLSASGESYDSEKLHATTNISIKRVLAVFTSPILKTIVKETIKNYWLVPIIFFIGIWYGIQKRKFKPIALTVGFSSIYIIAICITFNHFDAFYAESELMPLSIISSAPFVYYFLPAISIRKATLVLILIFSVRLVYIGMAADKFVERKNWNMATLHKMKKEKITKAIIYQNAENQQALLMNWGSPTESIIASALLNENPQRTFVIGTSENIEQRHTTDPFQIISCFELWHYKDLNHRYFKFDTTSTYRLLDK